MSLLCALAFCPAARPADANASSPQYRFKIAPQSLAGALQEFARQCGIQIIFLSRTVEGRQAPALEGDYALAAALTRLLADSKLGFRVINSRTVEVHPLPTERESVRAADTRSKPNANEAAPASRKSAGPPHPIEEVVVMGTAEQLVATRIATPLREIPQTVSIVSREQSRQQNHTDLADVLRRAPGLTAVRANSLDQDFYSRGYKITSFHVDGGAALNPTILPTLVFLSTPDLSEFERAEVLRGSDALFGGNGNPGGTVSLVRKRPRDSADLSLSAVTGSWNSRRFEADLTGPIAAEGALRGRIDLLYAKHDYFYEMANRERRKIFAAAEYDFTPEATLTVGASYQEDRGRPFVNGWPMFANGGDARLSRDFALNFDWAYERERLIEAYVQYRQDLAGTWTLKLNAARWRVRSEYGFGQFGEAIDPVTHGVPSAAVGQFTGQPTVHTQLTGDATLSGQFDWFGWREQIAVGGDFTRLEANLDWHTGRMSGTPLQDVADFDPRDYPDPRVTQPIALLNFAGRAMRDQHGFFGSMRVNFNDAWSAVAGARIGTDGSDSKILIRVGGVPGPGLTLATKSGSSDVVTPYAGLMYDIDDHYSVYASYADIYLTSGLRLRSDGRPIGASHGINYEAGIKGAWRNGALNGSLVLYRIAQKNLPKIAPEGLVNLGCCFVSTTSHSQGIELELSGELVPGWLVGAGYSYNTNNTSERDIEAAGAAISAQTPMHLLKLWTSKQLPGDLQRWTLGASLHAQTTTAASPYSYCAFGQEPCVRFEIVQDPYAVLDLRTSYRIDSHWQLALSINNVFDKVYYESVGPMPLLSAWYGEPRNIMLRVDGSY